MHTIDTYHQTWTFEWVKEHSRDFKNELLEGWRITTRPHQTPSQDSYLVAHDVFHHHPNDRGTYADEVFSFGVELYMESAKKSFEEQRSDLQSAWFSVMALTIDMGTKGLEGILLSDKHPQLELTEFEEQFKKMYTDSIDELKLDFYAYGDYDLWQRLVSRPQINKAASKMAQGFRWAQETYPDPQRFLAMFNQVRKASEQAGNIGDQFTVEQIGNIITVTHLFKHNGDKPSLRSCSM